MAFLSEVFNVTVTYRHTLLRQQRHVNRSYTTLYKGLPYRWKLECCRISQLSEGLYNTGRATSMSLKK